LQRLGKTVGSDSLLWHDGASIPETAY
jgi:hypothetical protein